MKFLPYEYRELDRLVGMQEAELLPAGGLR